MAFKVDEIVFYISNGKLAVGKVARKVDVDKWTIMPLQKGKELAKRKADKIFPVKYYKKYLTFSK